MSDLMLFFAINAETASAIARELARNAKLLAETPPLLPH
jgi:hypothetical protein